MSPPHGPTGSPIWLPLGVAALAAALLWALYEFSFKPSVEDFRSPDPTQGQR